MLTQRIYSAFMVSVTNPKTKSKVGPDGLTKQQRWVKRSVSLFDIYTEYLFKLYLSLTALFFSRNRTVVNAANARRNRDERRSSCC